MELFLQNVIVFSIAGLALGSLVGYYWNASKKKDKACAKDCACKRKKERPFK